MLILWILLGVVVGMIAAYLWLGKQHRKAMADLEGSWYEKVRRAEDAAAKAMAEAEAIKAGDDPKMVSLRRIEEAEAPAAEAPKPDAKSSDDLTKISGVGPVLKDKLYAIGITTFRQIADMTPEDIARVDKVLDFPGRVEREDWIGQARKMIQGESRPA